MPRKDRPQCLLSFVWPVRTLTVKGSPNWRGFNHANDCGGHNPLPQAGVFTLLSPHMHTLKRWAAAAASAGLDFRCLHTNKQVLVACDTLC